MYRFKIPELSFYILYNSTSRLCEPISFFSCLYKPDPLENCHLNVKKMAKNLPFKKYCQKLLFFGNNENFWRIYFWKCIHLKKIIVKFLTFKWQFSEGSGRDFWYKMSIKKIGEFRYKISFSFLPYKLQLTVSGLLLMYTCIFTCISYSLVKLTSC